MTFRFHIIYPYFILPNAENTVCAFTQKARKFSKMMTGKGHFVYFYGHEKTQVECNELVAVLSEQDFITAYGKEPDWLDAKYTSQCVNKSNEMPQSFIKDKYYNRTIPAIQSRLQPNDFICSFWGVPEIIKPLKNEGAIIVEPGIGCPRIFSEFCAFESYAIMHNVYGKMNISPRIYDAVIPNYFDLDEFKLVKEIPLLKFDNYFLFLGRKVINKGIAVVLELALKFPNENFVIVGPGNLSELNIYISPNVYEYPAVGSHERNIWMSGAKGFLLPTCYLEPFGGTVVESMLCGTPVITSDWGVFAETVLHGITGYRCRTLDHYIWAINNVTKLSRNKCRFWAEKNYSLDAVYILYNEWFQMLTRYHSKSEDDCKYLGYYSENPSRTNLDWLNKYFPTSGSITSDSTITSGSITSDSTITSGSITSDSTITSGSITSGSITSDSTITTTGDIEKTRQIHKNKKSLAIYCEDKWAFGTLFNGLKKVLQQNYNIEFFSWSKNYPVNKFEDFDLVLTSTWDTAKVFESRYKTRYPVAFCGHSIVEFINHDFKNMVKI